MIVPYLVMVGSASVGKTTTVKALIPVLEEMYQQPIVYIAEVARTLQRRGVKINKDATSLTQRMIEDEYSRIEAENTAHIKVADRSIIDRYAYATLNGGPSSDLDKRVLLEWYHNNIVEHCKKYSHIFHIPLTDELQLESDGVRSMDEVYRKEVATLQTSIIRKYNIEVHVLTGPTTERISQVRKVLKERK